MTGASQPRQRLVVLISGRGSNLQAIAEACHHEAWPAEIAGVLSSRPDAAGLQSARERGLPVTALDHRTYADREAFDRAMIEAIEALRPDWVVLAGFMRILSRHFVRQYADRLVNIHPSLLPSFPGLATHRQALQAGVAVHGATVHRVIDEVDGGAILAQAVVPVHAGDDESTLARRVLAAEHRLYPKVLGWLVNGRLVFTKDGGSAWSGGQPETRWMWSD